MSTFLTTSTGRSVDLYRPAAGAISVADIAAQLAKENRYNGATARPYSVAEHSVRCAHAALTLYDGDCRPQLVAAYALCHDFHEAYLKDDTTPKKRALGRVAREFGALAEAVDEAYAALTGHLDAAIHEAVGLPWPIAPEMERAVRRIDRALLVTEWRDLEVGGGAPLHGYGDAAPLAGRIVPWGWEEAEAALLRACELLLPRCPDPGAPA